MKHHVRTLACVLGLLTATALAACAGQAAMPGMDHSSMPGMTPEQHARMSGMDHSTMPGMDHSKMPGMEHGAAAPAMEFAPPATNAAIAATQPAATLRGDELDAPAPAAVEEAAKAAGGMTHSMEGAAPPHQHAPPPPPPAEHYHGHGGAS